MSQIMLKKLSKFSFLLFFILFSTASFPQTDRANYKILGIAVEGNKYADANTIIANSGLKVNGEIEIPGDQTINAIKKLWALNIFSDVQILIDKKIQNGVFLVIKVKEHMRVEDFVVEGEDEIDEDDIKDKVSFVRGQILKPQDIYDVKNKIKLMYDEEGYLNAVITPTIMVYGFADTTDDEIEITWRNEKDFSDEYKTTYDRSNVASNFITKAKERALLRFSIDEGDEVVVRKIEFNGNQAFSDGKLKGAFDETEEAKWWKFWSGANLKKEDYEKDKQLLGDFYKRNGYRDFEIISDSIIYSEDKKDVFITINVMEGVQYKIRNIEWEGNTIYPDLALSERLGFRKGDIYDYEKFNRNLRGNEQQTDVAALYFDTGYLMLNMEPIETRAGQDSIDVLIRVSENNRFKIGSVDIKGNDKTKEKVIRRELYTLPGDYFSRAMLFRSIQQLANLQYFNVEKLYSEGVDYNPVNDSTVNVAYKVEEKSSDYLNASVGYSGSYGFSGSIGVTLTNFSLAEPFSLGGGQILNFSWQFGVSNYYRTFTLGFTEPWFMDTPTMVGFEVFDTRQNYVYELSQTGLTLRAGRRLKWPDNFFNITGFLRFQKNNIINGGQYYQEGKSEQFTFGATLSRRDIDNPIFPSNGSSVALDAEMSGGPLLPGNVDYYKTVFTADLYKRLFNTNRLTFYTGAQFGYMDEFRSGTLINPFEYFFMGGNGLVIATVPLRGYDDRTINQIDEETGNRVGGRIYSKYTAEVRAAAALEPIPIYFILFAEAGNTYLNLKSADFFDLKRSAGVGARLMINPIGLIGFDLGYGFDRKEVDGEDPSWVFHFQFGKGF